MKKLIIPLSLLLLVACGQKAPKAEDAQEVQDSIKEKSKGPFAQIEFLEGTEYDFGVYDERVDKIHDFIFRNPSKVPLIINDIKTSCSCAMATGPKNPVLEGQTDTIHVKYNGNGFVEGYWIKHIGVYANIKEEYIGLSISGIYVDKKDK